MRCQLGQRWDGQACKGTPTRYQWRGAVWRARVFNLFGGYAGSREWRLPTIDELVTLEVVEPRIASKAFPNSGNALWSSSLSNITYGGSRRPLCTGVSITEWNRYEEYDIGVRLVLAGSGFGI